MNLSKNEPYMRKVLPFLKDEYFIQEEDRVLFGEIKKFIVKYNTVPSIDALLIEVDNQKNLTDTQVKMIRETIELIHAQPIDTNMEWLVEASEKFCKDKALYIAIMKSIEVMQEDKHSSLSRGAIPGLLQDALSVSFDPNIGHDYFKDASQRYDYYHQVLERMPFDLDFFNKITNGGLPRKTLNVILAGTGVGKSLFMCHMAANCITQGKNVLYITLELSAEEVGKRIDANLFNVALDELKSIPRDLYDKKIQQLESKTNGTLVVKEYPTAGASVIHFKALLNELSLKKKFVPDIIFVDYLNICQSARIKMGSNINSYSYVKSIAEELRGLAQEANVPLMTATQTNRTGFTSSDVGLEDTSESFGVPATADFMFVAISTEELAKLNQLLIKQLKSRYGDINQNARFVIGIKREKMKLFDVEQSAQASISNSGQTPPATKTNGISNGFSASPKDKFKGVKV
jgi:replicative DNA helicase